MRKVLLIMLACVTLCVAVSCGNDVEVVKNFYDQNGQVFLENGKMHKATTQFTDEEMLQRLHTAAWLRNYAFYYDKHKAGKRNEISFYESNYYVFSTDGQAYMSSVTNPRSRMDFLYTTSGRNITLRSGDNTLTMRVVAIDDTLMVTDTPMTGMNIIDYDDATVTQRTVFIKYQPQH